MNKTRKLSALSFALCIVLIAAMALCTMGCNGKDAPAPTGEEVTFTFTVTDKEGNETSFEVETDKGTVGEALLEKGLIAGEDGPYGLYVKTVNGQTLDYDKDGMYWAFYENGSYAATGVDKTAVTPGATYGFKAES